MKKTLLLLLALSLMLVNIGCGSPKETTQPAPTTQETISAEAVVFADPTLERMVRAALGRPEGDITAAEASTVTALNLSFEWQRYLEGATPIKDIRGLERFVNLESLDLSYHAIGDITQLSGLNKLVSLSLNENPVADLTPLKGLTNLRVLALSGSNVQDCSALGALANLNVLELSHSQVADITALSALKNLKRISLKDCPVADFTPLADIYQTLEEKDFKLSSTLDELGFVMNAERNQTVYDGEDFSVRINRPEWGEPQQEWERNCIWLTLHLPNGYTLDIGDYVEIDAYVFQMSRDGEMVMNYVYDEAHGSLLLDEAAREKTEQVLRDAIGEQAGDDFLLSPIPLFNDAIKKNFNMLPDALYALPLAP